MSQIREIQAVLEKGDKRIVEELRRRLGKIVGAAGGVDFQSARFRELLRDIREIRVEVIREARSELRTKLLQFSRSEADFERELLELAVPVELSLTAVAADSIREAVTKRPFQGRTLGQWWDSLSDADQRALTDAIQMGLSNGEDVDTIVRRVVGSRARNYSDGALSITRRNAEAVVRTAINHASNAARESLWEGNEDIVLALRWTSVLDGRTSAVCRGRDGALAPVGGKPLPKGSRMLQPPDARPPAHVSCRSIMVAVLDEAGIVGTRPFVTDTRTSERRRVDFREIAREKGISVQEARSRWASANIGQVPAETSYNDWLVRQSHAFQDRVLGKTKARLFRAGKIRLEQFIDRRGNELSLDELASQRPDAFRVAGLNPEEF
jgi:hypothetical protein